MFFSLPKKTILLKNLCNKIRPTPSIPSYFKSNINSLRMIIKFDIFEWTSPQIFPIVPLFPFFPCLPRCRFYVRYFQWEFPFTIINIKFISLDTCFHTSQYLQLIRFRRFYFLIFLPSAQTHMYANIIASCFGAQLVSILLFLFPLFSVLFYFGIILLNCMHYFHKFRYVEDEAY